MKHALLTKLKPIVETRPELPIRQRLIKINVNDYSLIAIRHYSLETPYSPRFYTLVSQNQKILSNEKISQPERVFLNFESFKWSELYFHFFKSFTHSSNHSFIFDHIICKLEILLAQYYTLIFKAQTPLTNHSCPIDRQKAQTKFFSLLMKQKWGQSLFVIYLYDLILISLYQDSRTICNGLVTPSEAQLHLDYFTAHNIVSIHQDKLRFDPSQWDDVLKNLVVHKGHKIISLKQIPDHYFKTWKHLFLSRMDNLDKKRFEASFVHD